MKIFALLVTLPDHHYVDLISDVKTVRTLFVKINIYANICDKEKKYVGNCMLLHGESCILGAIDGML